MMAKPQGQTKPPQKGKAGVGLGLEWLGVIALKFPKCALLFVVLSSFGLAFAAVHLSFNSEIREVFRSDQSEFEQFENMISQYPGNERTIFVVVQGRITFHKTGLEPLSAVHAELSALGDVQKVLSPFTLLRPSADGGTEPLIAADLDNLPDAETLEQTVVANALAKGTLVSRHMDAMLFMVVLDDEDWSLQQIETALVRLRDTLDAALADTGFTYDLAGLPMIRNEIIGALKRDQTVFKLIGLLLGAGITWLYFRNLRYLIITLVPSTVAIIWLLGLQAMMGFQITVLNNVVPVLVMVIAFADSLHLAFAIQRKLTAGMAPDAAITQAVREVGPACALTSLTTSVCIGMLYFLPQSFLSGFGALAALGTALAFVAIMLTLPPLARLLLKPVQAQADRNSKLSAFIEDCCLLVSEVSLRRPGAVTVAAASILAIAATCYFFTEPRYLYRDHLPRNSVVERATQQIDEKFSGVAEVRVLMQWPKGQDLLSKEVVAAVRRIHEWMARQPEVKHVRSLLSIQDILVDTSGAFAQEAPAHFLGSVTPHKFALLYAGELGVASADHSSTLVVAQTLDLPASDLLPFLDRLKTVLDEVEAKRSGLKAYYTGIAPLAASMSTQMIEQLNRSLLLAIVLVVVLIGIVFRSVWATVVALIPNLLPITIGGTYLLFSGNGLQFTSVVAFTVGFGIAVDNTIHLLNRYHIEHAVLSDLSQSLSATITKTGPVLVTGTLVLMAGLGSTTASSLPMVILFGQVSVIVLAVALVASILLFPAQLLSLDRIGKRLF